MPTIQTLVEAVQALDTMPQEPTNFEANVLETVQRQFQRSGRLPSPAQQRILREMVEKYLKDWSLLRALEEG